MLSGLTCASLEDGLWAIEDSGIPVLKERSEGTYRAGLEAMAWRGYLSSKARGGKMGNKLLIAFLEMAVLCTSPGWAGSMGNGAAQRRAAAGLAPLPEKPRYVFCFGGNPNSVYFSAVIAQAPSPRPPNLGIAYGKYLTRAGFRNDGGQCVNAEVRADAVAEKERREASFGTRKVIQTGWTGPGSAP